LAYGKKLLFSATSIAVRFDVVTLFPDFFDSPLRSGLLGKALTKQLATVNLVNPRDFTTDRHRKVDDEPYGGGVGMVLKPEPIFAAIESLPAVERSQVILLSPQGQTMSRGLFRELVADYDRLVLLCGHYEGIDVDREVSLGDFVLTGGEIPALALINGVTRIIPGTVGKEQSLLEESFESELLDYPHYTRPAEFRGQSVPKVLMSGNHKEIQKWRRDRQIERTKEKRPDLYRLWLEKSP
jgi:tRNA (guanine37-N1)-methyltransferase